MIRGKSMKVMECLPVMICFPPVQCTWYPFVPGATDTLVEVSPHLSTMLHTSSAGPALAQKLLYLCLKHYSLASTTVTGIPMKEEQNASSSANYDVELFHVAEAHAALLGDTGDLPLTKKEECEYDTVSLIIIIIIIIIVIVIIR